MQKIFRKYLLTFLKISTIFLSFYIIKFNFVLLYFLLSAAEKISSLIINCVLKFTRLLSKTMYLNHYAYTFSLYNFCRTFQLE